MDLRGRIDLEVVQRPADAIAAVDEDVAVLGQELAQAAHQRLRRNWLGPGVPLARVDIGRHRSLEIGQEVPPPPGLIGVGVQRLTALDQVVQRYPKLGDDAECNGEIPSNDAMIEVDVHEGAVGNERLIPAIGGQALKAGAKHEERVVGNGVGGVLENVMPGPRAGRQAVTAHAPSGGFRGTSPWPRWSS